MRKVLPHYQFEETCLSKMTIEVLPDSPSGLSMSPRISFSYDLPQSDVVPVEEYIHTTSSSTIDFDFCVFRESFDHQSSTADELFFNGQILPIQIKKRLSPPTPPPLTPPLPSRAEQAPPAPPRKPRLPGANEPKSANADPSTEEKQKSFWRFNRSSSLNCGSGYGRTLCPLPLLSRSNSTGSTASGKRSSLSTHQKQSFLRHQASSGSQKQPAASRPPLKRSSHGIHGNGTKFNPVLHVSSANLFGLGSIFSVGKDRIKKKY